MATDNGFQIHERNAPPFFLVTTERFRGPSDTLHVVIEGDGMSYYDEYTPSDDPTPTDPMALRIASSDNHPLIATIARPCQYTRTEQASCRPSVWTTDRYSEASVASLNKALDILKKESQAIHLHLMGYSGGERMW